MLDDRVMVDDQDADLPSDGLGSGNRGDLLAELAPSPPVAGSRWRSEPPPLSRW
jgi:hypothetical protein